MTREQAKANLVTLGVAEPTDEQITNYLNQFSGETNTLKTQLADAQKNAQNVEDLKKQLKDLQDSKLTDEEKAQKEAEEKAQHIADLEKQVQEMKLKGQLAEQGITGDDADKLIASSSGGSLNVELLGQIIKAKEEAAAKAKEEEIANKSTNPNGSSGEGAGGGDEKPADVQLVESLVKSFGTETKEDKDFYLK